MRGLATLVVMMATACRFDPTGGVGVVGDAAIADGPGPDGLAIDAPAIDAVVIDAPMLDAPRAACPAAYNVTHLGRAYVFRTSAAQYAIAEADCADDLAGRTHLATFELVAVMDEAINAVDPGNSAQPWVGAKCPVGDCSFTLAWFWVTGLPVDASAWDQDQPDNGATEKVAWASRRNGTWKLANVLATETRPYICECEP